MANLKIDQRKIIFKGSEICSFDERIITALQVKEQIIVVLDVPQGNINYNQNTICIDLNGKKLWSIEAREYHSKDCPANNVYLEQENLKIYRWCGIEEIIDLENGKILSSELIK